MLKGIIIGVIVFLIIDFIIGLCLYFSNPYDINPPKEKKKKPKKEISDKAINTSLYLGFMPLSFFYSIVKLSNERKARKKLLRGLHYWWF